MEVVRGLNPPVPSALENILQLPRRCVLAPNDRSIFISLFFYLSIHVSIYVMYVYMYVMYVCVYVCMYVCICVLINERRWIRAGRELPIHVIFLFLYRLSEFVRRMLDENLAKKSASLSKTQPLPRPITSVAPVFALCVGAVLGAIATSILLKKS